MDIITYLESNNIVVGEEEFRRGNLYESIDDAKKQIDLIIYLQKLMMSQKNTIIPRIDSVIGKELEEYKIQQRRIIRNINTLKERSNRNRLDEYFIQKGNKILEVAQKSILLINEEEYLNIIKRSMRNYEICLGRVDENNLKMDKDGSIKVRTTRYFSYNLIEHDILNYTKRLKRRGHKDIISDLIIYFVDKTGLEENSTQYIQALNSYPLESMKVLYKYLYQKDFLEKDWEGEINKAIQIDANELW